MGTLQRELGAHATRIAGRPRVYVDANVPAGLVAFMRVRLEWDVLFVVEHDDLRRASDAEHYQRARDLQRTIVTLDRDYLDDRAFPPLQSGGVLVLSAPNEPSLAILLQKLDARIFRRAVGDVPLPPAALPLERRKLHLHWPGEELDQEP